MVKFVKIVEYTMVLIQFQNIFIFMKKKINKIRKKSVYQRKYHIYNKIHNLKNNQITYNEKVKVISIFNEIDKILPEINQNRKRMINIDFILKNIFEMLKINLSKEIEISKCEKTIKKYSDYWNKIQLLISDKIQTIINKKNI